MSTAAAPGRPPEQVIARLRPHGRGLVLPTALLVVVAGGTVYLLGVLVVDWQRILLLVVAGAAALAGFVIPVLRFLTRTLTVTSRRVVVRSGMLVHRREELLHSSGYRVALRRRPLQLVFGCGDLVLEVGGDHRIRVRDVPKVRLVQEALSDLVDDALRRPPDAPAPYSAG